MCELGCFCVQQFLDFSWESITSDKCYYCHYDCCCRSCAPCHWFMKYHDVGVLPHHPSDHHRNLYFAASWVVEHPASQKNKNISTLTPEPTENPYWKQKLTFFPKPFQWVWFCCHFHRRQRKCLKKNTGELPTFGSPTSKIAGQESLVRVYNRLANRQAKTCCFLLSIESRWPGSQQKCPLPWVRYLRVVGKNVKLLWFWTSV